MSTSAVLVVAWIGVVAVRRSAGSGRWNGHGTTGRKIDTGLTDAIAERKGEVMPSLKEIVREVDDRARSGPIGHLQELRERVLGLQRRPSRNLLDYARAEDWTFHVGGRHELRFNLGFETPPFEEGDFRFGIVFSLEMSRSMPAIEPLVPKIALFNDYLREHQDELAGLWMWHHAAGGRSPLRRPVVIDSTLVRSGVFIFLGGIGHRAHPEYDIVLDVLDRLLPMWMFIEDNVAGRGPSVAGERRLRTGRPTRLLATWRSDVERTLAVDLRHAALQQVP